MKRRRPTFEEQRAAHVVLGPAPHLATCTRCGATLDVRLPVPVNAVLNSIHDFLRRHRYCNPTAEAGTTSTPGGGASERSGAASPAQR